MKLGIFCNFGPFEQVGGSEMVIEHISRGLTERYGYEINIYAFNYKKPSVCRGINLCPCKKGKDVISQINENDHIFIYSSDFWQLDTILQNIEKIDCGASLSLVGGYHLRSHPDIFDLLKKNIDKFNLITHSSITPDYKWCVDNGLDINVIPNGVDLNEFKNNTINFREKYKIKEKVIILSIFNYFYGKGFNKLPETYRELEKKLKDFIIIQISSSIKYPYEKRFLERCKYECRNMNIRFLRNIPREDVISAFKNSSVYLNLSFKEVAPLVILESQAAGLPWISMDVGDVKDRKGGVIVNNTNEDDKGYKIVDDKIIDDFVFGIECIIRGNLIVTGESVKKKLVTEGREDIEKLDWKNIVPEYDKVFNK